MAKPLPKIGDFVRAVSNDLGPGRLLSVDPDGTAKVQYFDSVAEDGQPTVSFPYADLEGTYVYPQSRVFYRLEGGDWRSGRVLHSSVGQEFFQIRAGSEEVAVPAGAILPRWKKALEDPVSVAIARGFESPHYAERRIPFLDCYLSQRASSRGMPAITSSVIELHPHQIHVARRVLQDPVQRYLLADEVGLGKTIETGIILRQLLLDIPTLRVLVLAPSFLILQWERELKNKFLIKNFPRAKINYASHDDPNEWPLRDEALDLVIVDEAQHLAGLWEHSGRQASEKFDKLRELAHAAERVLLLSATPVLHHEAAFLAMLHLIDPDLHSLDDLETFRQRLAQRTEIGELFFTFVEGTPRFLLAEKIERLRDLFPKDARLLALLSELDAVLETGDDPANLVRAVRAHISESYRIHRRMLRTRREGAASLSYRVAGRSAPTRSEVDEPQTRTLNQLTDDWRHVVLARVDDDPRVSEQDAVRGFRRLLTALLNGPDELKSWAAERLGNVESEGSTGGFQPDEEEVELLEGIISSIADTGEATAVVLAAVDLALDEVRGRQKALIFTSSTRVARQIYEELRSFLVRPDQVGLHAAELDQSEAEDAVVRFEDPASSCQWLVCDYSAEEGRNLQIAEVVIHVDLPTHPNRLEQRIGRFDRFAIRDGEPARSFVLSDKVSPPSYRDAWLQCVQEGYGVFEGSIASLQHAVDGITEELWMAVLRNGSSELVDRIPWIRETLEAERLLVAQQDALDSIDVVEDDDDFYSQLAEMEASWKGFQHAALALLDRDGGSPGHLRFTTCTDDQGRIAFDMDGTFKDKFVNRMPLVPWDRLVGMAGFLKKPGVFDRGLAVRLGDETHLFRYGEPLIDKVADYLQEDDRGRIYGIWRQAVPAELSDGVFFLFRFRVEPNVLELRNLGESLLDKNADLNALLRRADEFLPPRIVDIWVQRNGQAVTDPEMLSALELPYEKRRRDRSLTGKRADWLDQLFSGDEWRDTLRRAQTSARECATSALELERMCDAAAARAEKVLGAKIEQLETRAQRFGNVEDRIQVDVERMLRGALLEGIQAPKIDIDTVGVYVLSESFPSVPE